MEELIPTLQEEGEEVIDTLREEGEETIDTVQEQTIIAGVQTINGKAGDLDLKTINDQDLLTAGNLSLATSAQLQAETEAREQADQTLQSAIDGKQAQLTNTQLAAVNSGIDSTKVGQIATNAENITSLQSSKQDKLSDAQLAAVNSGIDSTKVGQIATNKSDIATLQANKQDKLTQTQLNAVNSGIDQTKVAQIATNTGNITSNTGRIATIEGKIPGAATSTNQLADKNYVDNSIATNTANYISDDGEPFQSLADLEAYSGTLTNNDYAFVVSTDSAGNLLYTRYKYNADLDLWAEEYTISNPTFTSTQWAAIDSGVTANDVTQIGTNKSDIANLQSGKQDALSQTQLDAINSGIDATKVQQIADNATAIATKQDKLIAGTNIQIAADGKTISATDTTYSAGTGIDLTGTTFSVDSSVVALQSDLPTKTSDLTNDGADGTSTYVENDDLTTALAGKQNTLTAGANVQIAGDTISATDTTYTAGTGLTLAGIEFSVTEPVPAGFFSNANATQEGTGTSYTLNDTVEAPIDSVELKGDTYQNGNPTPDAPINVNVVTGDQTIKLTGKNLCSSATVRSTTHIDFVADCAAITSNKVVLSAITNDTVSNASVYVFVDDVDLHQSAGAFSGTAGQRGYAVLTLQQTVMDAIRAGKTLKLDLYKGSGSFSSVSNAQIELGDQMTDYESYRAQSYTIELGSIELCKIGTYQDYIWKDGDTWKVHKAVKKVLLDGSEAISESTVGTDFSAYYIAMSDVKPNGDAMSDYFLQITSNEAVNAQKAGLTPHASLQRLYIDIPNALKPLSTWLSTHNTTVYYALDTPTDTAITNSTLIAQLNALAQAKTYAPRTNVITSAVSPNLPAIAWLKVYNDNMAGVEGAIGNVNDTLGGKASKDFALEQGSVTPSFTGLIPIKTFTWTVADTTYRPVYQMDNTDWANDNMDITVAYRITVTGTGISQIADIIDRWHYPTTAPVTSMMNRSLSGSNATTGFRILRAVYPNTSGLNNNTYKIGQEIQNYNSTSRTIKVEVFKTDPKVTWNETKPAGSIYAGSTYQSNNNLTVGTNRGWLLRQPTVLNASSANSATRISSYESATVASSVIKAGATALVANHLAFQATDGLIYDISNTTKNMVCDDNAKIGFISNAISANGAIDTTYMRQLYNLPSTAVGYIPHATIALGDRVYLRCTMDGSGNIHSDNYLATSMSAGYTWVSFGMATAADTIYMDARRPMFYTLDVNGKLTHINGLPIAGGGA